MTDEIRYRLLRCLEETPHASQRELARRLGISVGKVNYCLHALIEKGSVKIKNFRKAKRKIAYAYVLTPKGIEENLDLTIRFLNRKIEEYNALFAEIEEIKREVEKKGLSVSGPAVRS
jgi:EPS-associated MarR family transcriptional regulator